METLSGVIFVRIKVGARASERGWIELYFLSALLLTYHLPQRLAACATVTRAVQLESIVTLPSEYIRAVGMIRNETDVSKLPLEDILPQATVMVVSVTASTTNGTQVYRKEAYW